MPETITSRDAARFPIIASCTLLGLYLFFKIFSQEYINLLLSMYFFVLGILALSHTISPFMNKFFPANFPNRQYQLLFTQGSGENKEEIINYEFDAKDLVCLGLSSIVGVWYLLRKHWIANNLFGLAFSLNGVELLHLNNVSTGCILLGGLFIYDVFWVFGTNVMVTVAKSFEAPIKLVFPQDLLEKGLEADNFAMLGLGDIVIPGEWAGVGATVQVVEGPERRRRTSTVMQPRHWERGRERPGNSRHPALGQPRVEHSHVPGPELGSGGDSSEQDRKASPLLGLSFKWGIRQ